MSYMICYLYLPLLTTPCHYLCVFPEFGGVCLLIKKHVKHGSCLREQERQKGGTPPTSQVLVMSVAWTRNGNPPNYLTWRCERTPQKKAFSSVVWWSKELLYYSHSVWLEDARDFCLFGIAAGHRLRSTQRKWCENRSIDLGELRQCTTLWSMIAYSSSKNHGRGNGYLPD